MIVADAFAGRLAIFSIAGMQLIAMKQFPGHNVRGLGRSPDGKKLLLSDQMLNDLAQTIRGDIHWGMLMSNDLRWLNTNSVLASGKELYFGSHMHPLGEAGRGASDPAGLDVGADGTVVIALAGVNEIAIGREADFSLTRVSVGRGPVAVKIIPPGDSAVVGNQYDDSLMVVNLKDKKVARTISLGIQPKELSLADRGELLFHDARLSHDRWMSCASCHPSGHTNGQTNDNFSDQSFGSPKRVLSLLGAKDTAPYAWNGKAETLAAQVRSSLEKTMQREEPPQADEVEAISAYLKTLELPPPVDELRGVKNEAAIHRGQRLFAAHDCARCHAPPTYTSPQTYDVGLKDDQGNTQFNPPSLRGLSHRGPYFHDNRAETLEDVFRVHHHPDATELPSAELADLIAFLRSL